MFAYGVTSTLLQVLKQCGDDFSRANIMKQAANLKDVEIPVLLPGIKVNTSPTNFHPIRQMQLEKWNGKIVGAVRPGDPGRRVLTRGSRKQGHRAPPSMTGGGLPGPPRGFVSANCRRRITRLLRRGITFDL